jgi:hypothetical protein
MAYEARILRFKEKNLAVGPRPVDFQLDSQRKTLRIFFQGLNGSLKPVSRLQGILVESGGYVPVESFEIKGNQVVLHFLTPLGPNAKLSYGKGYNPVINLYDSANMPVPIFGPVTLP